MKILGFFMLIQLSSEPGPDFKAPNMVPAAHTFEMQKVGGFPSLDSCNQVADMVIKNQMASTKAVSRYTKADCYPILDLEKEEPDGPRVE